MTLTCQETSQSSSAAASPPSLATPGPDKRRCAPAVANNMALPGDLPVILRGGLAALSGHASVRAVQVDPAEHRAGGVDEPGHTLLAGRVAAYRRGAAGGRHLGRQRGVDVVHHHA